MIDFFVQMGTLVKNQNSTCVIAKYAMKHVEKNSMRSAEILHEDMHSHLDGVSLDWGK